MGAGEAWKKRREAMGMTVDEAAAVLRISRRYIVGIEEGDYKGWPERVFSTGFIRSYAKLLSEDPEPVLSEFYQHAERVSSGEPTGIAPPEWLERERRKGTRRTSYALATTVVLLIGILLAWYASRTATRPPVEPPAPPPTAAKPPAPPPDAKAAGVPAPPSKDNAASSVPLPPPDNAAASPGPPAQGSVSTIGGVGPVVSPYQLFLEASELTWIMYSLDEGEPVDVMLYPGDKISIQARKKIFLKLGNAGGLVGTLNGKRLPPFGARGQVKEVRLGE
jgi:cytoskeleton protein RodZ